MKLVQKHCGTKNTYMIKDEGLYVTKSQVFLKKETFVPYEKITKKKHYISQNSSIFIILLILLTIIFLLITDYNNIKSFLGDIIKTLPIYALLVYMYLYYKQDKILIECSNQSFIHIFKDKPDLHYVEDFMEKLITHRDIYLKNKYTNTIYSVNIEDYKYKLVNLLHENIINEDEYNILIKEYYDKEKKELNKIGFKEL